MDSSIMIVFISPEEGSKDPVTNLLIYVLNAMLSCQKKILIVLEIGEAGKKYEI